MKLLEIVAILSIICVIYAENQRGLLQCLKDGDDYKMIIVVYTKDDLVTIMYAVTAGAKDDNCKTGVRQLIEEFGSGVTRYWKLEVTFTGTTLTSNDDCGALKEGDTYKWKFATRTRPDDQYGNIMFLGDMNYEASCNFVTQQENLVQSANIDIAGEWSADLSHRDDDVTLSIVQPDGATRVTTSQLGDSIRLKVDLVAVPNGPTGVSPYSCKACDAEDCSGVAPYQITDANGCYETNQHIGSPLATSFSGSEVNLITDPFSNFVFNGASKTVWFICRIDFCYGSDVVTCSDRCTTLIAGKRKRRETGVMRDHGNTTSRASVTITINSPPQQERPAGRDDKELQVCLTNVVFMAVMISLSLLLVGLGVVATRAHYLLQKFRKREGSNTFSDLNKH